MQSTDEMIDAVLAREQEAAPQLARAHEAAWRASDPVLLELCRLRVAMLLGCEPELAVRTPVAVAAGLDEATVAELASWRSSARFSARERACLEFCEGFVMDVAGVTDELALDVADHLGAEGLCTFATALLVVEQRQRLRLAWMALDLVGAP